MMLLRVGCGVGGIIIQNYFAKSGKDLMNGRLAADLESIFLWRRLRVWRQTSDVTIASVVIILCR